MRLNRFRPGWPLIVAEITLQTFAAAAVGMAGVALLDYVGVAGARDTGNAEALLWAAGFVVAGGFLALLGTVLLRRGQRR
jgi:hypothetical protein